MTISYGYFFVQSYEFRVMIAFWVINAYYYHNSYCLVLLIE